MRPGWFTCSSDPEPVAFLSTDPVTAYSKPTLQFHRYGYANSNPYRFRDPDGRESVGEAIDSGAVDCGPVSCAGWAALNAVWSVFGAEGISQITDKGWSSAGGGSKAEAGLEVAAVLPAIKLARGVGIVAKASSNAIGVSRSQLQHAFKHAADFGVTGNANNKTLAEFSAAVQKHVESASTMEIKGTYRGNPVTHHLDPTTRLNVIRNSNGEFLSGWKLGDEQFKHVMDSGNPGGGK